MRRSAPGVLSLLVLTACSEPTTAGDAARGVDGAAIDAASTLDAPLVLHDVGPLPDAGWSAPPLVGEVGVWENVTPAEIDLDPARADNFGVQDVLADPLRPGRFYAFVCLQGVFRSDDWGRSWTHVSTDGELERGKPWGEAIAWDGSYMLASNGNVNQGVWRSTDEGATWAHHPMGGNDDPYMFDIDPADPQHVIGSTHSTGHVYESFDGGLTWSDRGDSGAGASSYVFFLTSTTWLAIGQSGDPGGTRRSTDSGGSWTRVGPMVHAHGNAQIVIDPTSGHVFVGSHEGGVFRSVDGGASFEQVSSQRASSLWMTEQRLYGMDPGANSAGTEPVLQIATLASGVDWAAAPTPPEMTNGAKRAAVVRDPASGHSVIVGGHWNAGIWRYIEP